MRRVFLWDGVRVDILWPEIVGAGARRRKTTIRWWSGCNTESDTILLPGDAEKQVEYEVLGESERDVRAHGRVEGSASREQEFDDAGISSGGAPQVSIISSGEENPYGHPGGELLERLEESGTRIFRTDQNGAVQVLTDGHNYR